VGFHILVFQPVSPVTGLSKDDPMAAYAIPESLIQRIRTGRAALVVGSSIGALAGMPSWKKILDRLRGELDSRGQAGDHEAAEDVAALLKKGRLVNAAWFLARTLGGGACDAVTAESWKTPDPLPQLIQVLGRVPIKAVWTVHPTDLVEKALVAGSPKDWPEPRVATYENAGELDTRRRYLLKLLGDVTQPESYVVIPTSVRRRLASQASYRAILADLYRDGALIFVGFRLGDPDLHAILDRVFGTFEPPTVEHYFVGAGLGPVDTAELLAEHHMTVVPLEGQGGDETSTQSLATYLDELARACDTAGISLANLRPEKDDLDGWLLRLAEDSKDVEAREAILTIEKSAREAGQTETLLNVFLGLVEAEPSAAQRARILRDMAHTYEVEVGDLPRAFTALTAALREDPSDEDTVTHAERLAAETDGWGELVADLSEIVPLLEDKQVAAGHWVRLGRWYHEKLHHHDYAIASYREALKLDPARMAARDGLEELYRKQLKWGELAEALAAHAEVAEDAEKKVDIYLSLGDLYESQLASTATAIEAYEKACAVDPGNSDGLAALERLYRRGERWGKLATVLDKRAEHFDETDPPRAVTYRKELASLRSERLGDDEGAILRYEANLKHNERDADALRGLEKLYEKLGRTEDYLKTLERLAQVVAEGERASLWRRVAVEVEEREGGAQRAIRSYEAVLDLEPHAVDAYRSLERLYRAEKDWDSVVRLHERHIASSTVPAQKVELYVALATLYEHDLQDPHRAIDAHVHATDIAVDHRESLTALSRLYRRVEAWDKAVATLLKHAELQGARGTDLWFEAGQIMAGEFKDGAAAEARFAKALELDPTHVPSLRALIEVNRKRGDFARAAQLMVETSKHSQNRLEKVNLLFEAGVLYADSIDAPETATELFGRVLALDPEHVEAGERAAQAWVAAGRWTEAEPVLEMLARKVSATDKAEKGRREALLGKAADVLGHAEKAAKHYRLAVEADPASLEAALGLAGLLFSQESWTESDKRYREILARHRPALAEGQLVDIWYRLGVSAQSRGDAKAAEDAFRRALERGPGHRASLQHMMELSTQRGDWKGVIEAKRGALEGENEEGRLHLLEEIGDLYVGKLADPVSALGAYLEALKIKPKWHVLLHKTLEIYTGERQWRHAIETLSRLAEQEKEPARRAKYFYTAAVIARDELKEAEEAVEYFTKALDDAPTTPKAFEAIEKILGGRADWKGLARAYRTMLKRLGERATEPQLLHLWTRLGDVYREKLGDRDAAIAAYEVAAALDRTDVSRHEQLAELYLEAGPDMREKAVIELQILLRKHPDRMDLYRSLSKLYTDLGQLDKSYCLAAAMCFLGQATEEEKQRYAAVRTRPFTLARRRLTEELWQKAILHPREDRALNGIFASLMTCLAATTAQPHQALQINLREKADPEKDPHLCARLFRYAVQVLGISPTPELYLTPQAQGGIRTANVVDKGVLVPAVLIGEPYLGKKQEREVAFDVGKKLAFFRPERFVYYALPTLPKLEAALLAALTATGLANGRSQHNDPEVERLSLHIKKTVPATVLEQVAALLRKLPSHAEGAVIPTWLTATDLTANRVGLILANDLETAARVIATEQGVQSALPAKDRLRELLSYSVSEEYFSVRRHLGIDIEQATSQT
jgi:tetratricopeptide (TPR) repeat protein